MGKYIGDCRLTHYGALLRKALDDAGYPEVAILTNDDVDYHDLHPGFRMNLMSAIRLAGALPMIDILEELLRKIRRMRRFPEAAIRHLMRRWISSWMAWSSMGFQALCEALKRRSSG